ncbi:MAG: tetratricopeptide repeat protein [Chloroflexi bacterium]|nr:tetratricopeptide repeat protein [Chloroflexota bacterium]
MRIAAAAIAEDDELRRLVAAAGDAEQRAHALLLHPGLVEDLAFQAGVGCERLGARRQLRRCEHVAGLVRQVAREVRSLAEDDADYYSNRGFAYAKLGQFDKAIENCSAAIWLSPDDSDYYHTRGSAYRKKGDAKRAAADFASARRLDPSIEPFLSAAP